MSLIRKDINLCLPDACNELVKDGNIITDSTAMQKKFSINGEEIVTSNVISYANGYNSAAIDFGKGCIIGLAIDVVVAIAGCAIIKYKRRQNNKKAV